MLSTRRVDDRTAAGACWRRAVARCGLVACILTALCGGVLGEKRSKVEMVTKETPRYMDRYLKAKEGINAEERAMRKRLQAEIEGGTFTVSNLGMFGVTRFMAIINPPQYQYNRTQE